MVEPTMKILILGNSITNHGPLPSIGWHNDWGMAASSADKDFVHVLKDSLLKYKSTYNLDYRERNIAYWERDFDYDFSKDALLRFKPDILIIRLGENVDENYAKSNNYELALTALIAKFKKKDTHVVITGNFWPSAYEDGIQRKVAVDNGYAFVDISDLAVDAKNQAQGQFENGGVAAHPSDYGMNNIATKIFKRIIAIVSYEIGMCRMVFEGTLSGRRIVRSLMDHMLEIYDKMNITLS